MERNNNKTWLDRGAEGTSTIELAVLLPFLTTLGFGMFEFGNLIYNYHLITAGVRDASRYLAGNPHPPGGADPVAAAKNIAMLGIANENGAFRIPWWNDASTIHVSYSTSTNNDAPYRNGNTITKITVSASIPYEPLGFLEFLNLEPITLTASHEERMYQNR